MGGSITFKDGRKYQLGYEYRETETVFEPTNTGPRSVSQQVASCLFAPAFARRPDHLRRTGTTRTH